MSMDSVMGAQFMPSSLSTCSSPRMQEDTRSEDETSSAGATEASAPKVKLMCSYGGRIMPRPHDAQLRYVGGETRILVVRRSISLASLNAKLARLSGCNSVFAKYKLPYEDLDALVSVICDDDLEAMFDEYDRLNARDTPSKLRLFLFPTSKIATVVVPAAGSGSAAQQFVDALNGDDQIAQQQQQVVLNPSQDFLFGFDHAPPDAGGSTRSSGSAASMIMEADSATQSALAPICTVATIPVSVAEPPHILSLLPPYTNIPSAPQQQQQENISVAFQRQDNIPSVFQQHVLSNMPQFQIQTSQLQQQILPPKCPKDKKDKVKNEKLPKSPESTGGSGCGGSPSKKAAKQQQQQQLGMQASAPFEADVYKQHQQSVPTPTVLSTTTSIDESQLIQEVDKLRIDEQVRQLIDEAADIIKQPDEQGRTGSPVQQLPTVLLNKEVSLNVFMEQQHKLEEALQKSKSLGEHASLPEMPIITSPQEPFVAKLPPQLDYGHRQQVVIQYPVASAAAGVAPLSHSGLPVPHFLQAPVMSYQQQQPTLQQQTQQQPQPYYIENNMIYYLASAPENAPQYMQTNEGGVQIQRAHSGPLPQQQQRVVQASAPLQRQLSAAYVDQLQQVPLAPNRVVYYHPVQTPVMTRPVGTNQPTSRFRDQVLSQAQQQVQQQQHFVELQRLQQQELVAPMRQVLPQDQQQLEEFRINQPTGMRIMQQVPPNQQLLIRQQDAAGNRAPGQ